MNGISASMLAALIVLTLLSTIVILRLSGERRTHGGHRRHKLRHTISANRAVAIPITPWDDDEDAGIEVHEHDSAVNAAEVLLDVGHTHGAAEVLSRFIEEHPKEAVTPWLRLLDTYRKAGAKDEYDTLAGRLTLHFNVHVRPWHQPSLPYCWPRIGSIPPRGRGTHAPLGHPRLPPLPGQTARRQSGWITRRLFRGDAG